MKQSLLLVQLQREPSQLIREQGTATCRGHCSTAPLPAAKPLTHLIESKHRRGLLSMGLGVLQVKKGGRGGGKCTLLPLRPRTGFILTPIKAYFSSILALALTLALLPGYTSHSCTATPRRTLIAGMGCVWCLLSWPSLKIRISM